MARETDKNPPQPADPRVRPDANVPPEMDDADHDARRSGLFGRWRQGITGAIEEGRAPNRERELVLESTAPPPAGAGADDLALRRAKAAKPQRTIVPEGVSINGSMVSNTETEISGRVDGDLTVENRLYLGSTAHVTGNVRAMSCRVDGRVEGKMECSHELELGETGKLNCDALAGKKLTVAGHVLGNVSCGGMLRLVRTAEVAGDIRTRRIVVEEGAMFNGHCIMRPPTQKED